MDVVSKINCILTNLQQVNTLLTSTMDALDALKAEAFKQSAGQESGLGGEFAITGLLEYLTYKCLKERGMNDS